MQSSKGFNNTNSTSVSTRVNGVALAVSEEIFRGGDIKISDLPIF